jgi:predicted peroxiredoxin
MRIAAITAAAAITAKHPIMIAALSMPCMAQSVSPARAAHRPHGIAACRSTTVMTLYGVPLRRRSHELRSTRKVQDVGLVIKVTAGENDPERCNQAFNVAATAVASGVNVSLWLTGESAWFALPGRAAEFKLLHAAPLEDLLGSVLAEGTVTLCTQCAARRSIEPSDVIDGIRIAGAPTFVAEVMDPDAKALVY